MELKPYQQAIISDLAQFLELLSEAESPREAYTAFWQARGIEPSHSLAIKPWKSAVKGIASVCLKVPTGGGKTYLACNALRPIFDREPQGLGKLVVWLVPSNSILEQTVNALKRPQHPYRERINAHFQNRVEVLEKDDLLQGRSFTPEALRDNLTICVLSYDSLRTSNKEGRKVYVENGNLLPFEQLDALVTDNLSVMGVIQQYRPVVVVDESHNASSKLSLSMLQELKPRFILELTATPGQDSNIISFGDIQAMRDANMVKLPIYVRNQPNVEEVLARAIDLQKNLEIDAIRAREEQGAPYIRPIVLVQAQSKGEDNATFDKLKKDLITAGVPEAHIRIKTANRNEIKGIDLTLESCEVRFIITINALREGWDCPFAYILATVANRSAEVEVTQIVGRILRMPYTAPHPIETLNSSYVLTNSDKFADTVQHIVDALNGAGFSAKDARAAAEQGIVDAKSAESQVAAAQPGSLFDQPAPPVFTPGGEYVHPEPAALTAGDSDLPTEGETPSVSTSGILAALQTAGEATAALKKEVQEQAAKTREAASKTVQTSVAGLSTEVTQGMPTTQIRPLFREIADQLRLPQFFLKGETSESLFAKNLILKGFDLSQADGNIDFESIYTELAMIDIDRNSEDHKAIRETISEPIRKQMEAYYFASNDPENQRKKFVTDLYKILKADNTNSDRGIKEYLHRILSGFSEAQLRHLMVNQALYISKIKAKIQSLADAYATNEFYRLVESGKDLVLKPNYAFKQQKSFQKAGKALTKSLYEQEPAINLFEEQVILKIIEMDNVLFWTRNAVHEFSINGVTNHYPDFIIQTKSGKIILLETKGDHLEAAVKTRLGNTWAANAGKEFRYYLVYENRQVDGTKTSAEFLNILRDM